MTDRHEIPWDAGDPAARAREILDGPTASGRILRLDFPERSHPPSREAVRIARRGGIGLVLQTIVRVRFRTAPDRTENAHPIDEWLVSPVLNRLPFALWFMGAADDVRIVCTRSKGSRVILALLRHEGGRRHTILETTISVADARDGKPWIEDGFEITGTDGFVIVHGVLGPSDYLPRLEVHRGAWVATRRALRREVATDPPPSRPSIGNVIGRKRRWSKEAELSRRYLETCRLVRERFLPVDARP